MQIFSLIFQRRKHNTQYGQLLENTTKGFGTSHFPKKFPKYFPKNFPKKFPKKINFFQKIKFIEGKVELAISCHFLEGINYDNVKLSQAADIGSDFLMTCNVEGSPKPTVSWRRGAPIPSTGSKSEVSTELMLSIIRTFLSASNKRIFF
jgi:hypothetical protein